MYRLVSFIVFLACITGFFACDPTAKEPLPILGQQKIINGDTLPHLIPGFTFMDQDSAVITNASFQGKAYVADFFFISCPTICPKVKQQMLRIYNRFEQEDKLLLLSHTIDIKYDTIPRLKQYAENLGVTSNRWHFVTGSKEDIYNIADDYFSIAIEDPDVPGGFDHSGRLILVDQNRQVRSFCNGTDPEDVERFMEDIETLLLEYQGS